MLFHSNHCLYFTFHTFRIWVQALMDEILMLQDEIGELQTCFSEELADSDSDGEAGDQLALQSTLTVLGERMATIRMKASGKRQLLEVGAWTRFSFTALKWAQFVIYTKLHTLNLACMLPWPLQERLSEQLEGQRQEKALQRYHSEAEELDHWLHSTRATLSSALQPINEDLDMEEQLIDCQVSFTFLLSSKAGLIGRLSTGRLSLVY